MADMREKLIELIQTSVGGCARHWAEIIADNLIEHGATVPPVKVGQVVYYINSWLSKDLWKVYEGKISGIQQKVDKTWKFRLSYHLGVKDCTIDTIGKTVFLTKEEAQKVLDKNI